MEHSGIAYVLRPSVSRDMRGRVARVSQDSDGKTTVTDLLPPRGIVVAETKRLLSLLSQYESGNEPTELYKIEQEMSTLLSEIDEIQSVKTIERIEFTKKVGDNVENIPDLLRRITNEELQEDLRVLLHWEEDK